MPGAERKLIVGCGYVGRRAAQAWLGQGSEVYALTRSAGNAQMLKELGLRPIIGDVTDPVSLSRLPEVDTVLYAVGFDRHSGKTFREVYVQGLENVLRQIAGCTQRFLYISSTSVYGQNAGEWVDETSICRPETPNGQACLEAEELVRKNFAVLNSDRPTFNVLRLAGIYGPGRLMARIEALRAGEPLHGNPEAWLNLTHVDDAVAAILACEQRGVPGELYLVSDDRPSRRCEYFAKLADALGIEPPLWESEPLADEARSRFNKRCSNRKLREQLGVELKYPTLAEGLPASL